MGQKRYVDLDEALASRLIKYYNKVILDRQFADVRDGLKNVQRRILYTMHKDGYTSNKAFVKSMRITGNVSSIHPHGDSYDSLANLISPHNIMQPLCSFIYIHCLNQAQFLCGVFCFYDFIVGFPEIIYILCEYFLTKQQYR